MGQEELSSYMSTSGAKGQGEFLTGLAILVTHFYFFINLPKKSCETVLLLLHIVFSLLSGLKKSIISSEGESEIQTNLCFFLLSIVIDWLW